MKEGLQHNISLDITELHDEICQQFVDEPVNEKTCDLMVKALQKYYKAHVEDLDFEDYYKIIVTPNYNEMTIEIKFEEKE